MANSKHRKQKKNAGKLPKKITMGEWRDVISEQFVNMQNQIKVLISANIHHGQIRYMSDKTIEVEQNHLAPEFCKHYNHTSHNCDKVDSVYVGKICPFQLWFSSCVLYKGINGRLPDQLVEEIDKGLTPAQMKEMGIEEIRDTPPPGWEEEEKQIDIEQVKADAQDKK